jgi:hypothetical protein
VTCVQLHKTSHTKDNFSISDKYNFVYCGKLQNYGVRFFLWKKMLCSKAYQYAMIKKKKKSANRWKRLCPWKLHKLHCTRQLHRLIILAKALKKWARHVYTWVFQLGSSKPQSRHCIFSSKVMFFQQTLEYADVITFFYCWQKFLVY